MAKVYQVINPKTGEETWSVEGVEGASCEDVTKIIEQENEVKEKQYTAEYWDEQALPDYIYDGG